MPWIILIAGIALVVVILLMRTTTGPVSAHSGAVTQQHLQLLQGAKLQDEAVQRAKAALIRQMQMRGPDRAGIGLRAGLDFVAQVEALAQIGDSSASDLLRRQLQLRLSEDPTEQSWYWLDVVRALRRFEDPESMPYLLRCPALRRNAPLHLQFAAETVCCAGFLDSLNRADSREGLLAIRALGLALRSLRYGSSPDVLAEGRLGKAVARLWRQKPPPALPGVAPAFLEALRLVHRGDMIRDSAAAAPRRREIETQLDLLADCRDALGEFLTGAAGPLIERLPDASNELRMELLSSLEDLQADAASAIIPGLAQWPIEHRELAIRVLRWSTSPDVGRWLCDWVFGTIDPGRRCRSGRRIPVWRPQAVDASFPYSTILYALRSQSSLESENLLLLAAKDGDAAIRCAAIGSLGWSEPQREFDVNRVLQGARSDGDAEVRHAAEATLARMGERRALQGYRASLAGETENAVDETIRIIARERILWLWPDLDALADSDDGSIALAARESLEQMRESVAGGILVR